MFSIYDGREKFYQWDKDRKIIVNSETITEVHFANCLCPSAKVCKVYDYDGMRVVDVPNELFTEYMDIKVWGFDGGMTKYSTTFEVEKKPKPDDYIYTPTEVFEYETVLAIAEEAKQVADSVRTDADNGVFDGEKGEKGDNNTDDSAIGDYPWSSKKILDTICYPIEEAGPVVSCEPVEGYPLEIGYEPKNLAVLRSMANYNIEGLTSSVNEDNTILINGISSIDANNIYLTNTAQWGNRIQLESGSYTIKVEVVDGTITNATCVLSISATGVSTKYEYFNLNEAKTFTVSALSSVVAIIQFSKNGEASNAKVRIQIEKGKEYTGYVDYNAMPTTITQCGKNLWNFKSGVSVVNYTTTADVYTERYGYRVKLPAGTYTAHAELVKDLGSSYQYVYGYIVKDNGDMVRTAHLVAAGDITTRTITLKEDECFLVCHGYSITAISESQANKLFNQGWNIQIEAGKTKTPYEAYNGNTFAFGEEITANSGVNYLFADSGNITVKGRENPVSTINKLTQAIISMGGNI